MCRKLMTHIHMLKNHIKSHVREHKLQQNSTYQHIDILLYIPTP